MPTTDCPFFTLYSLDENLWDFDPGKRRTRTSSLRGELSKELTMRAFATAASGALIVTLLTIPVLADQNSSKQCSVVQFPDIMDISKCVNGNINLCKAPKDELSQTTKTLAKCLVKSIFTLNTGMIFLRGLAEGIKLAVEVSIPGSSVVIDPIVNLIEKLLLSSSGDKIIWTLRSCDEKVGVNVDDLLRLGDCIRPEHLMCTKTGSIDPASQATKTLTSLVTCAALKIPQNLMDLLKEMLCSASDLVTSKVEFMKPVTDLLQKFLKCDTE